MVGEPAGFRGLNSTMGMTSNAREGHDLEPTPLSKEYHATNLLVKGQPQSFIDFFLLTHETYPHAIKPVNPEHEPERLGGGEEVAVESMPILSHQLIRAEMGHQKGDHKAVYDAYHTLGNHFEHVDNPKKALLFYYRSLEMAELAGYEEGKKCANLALGYVHQKTGDLEAAGSCHERFLEHGDGEEEVSVESNPAISSLVQIYIKRAEQEESEGNIGTALEYLNKCSECAEKVNDTKALAHINHRLGVLHQQRGDYQKALHFHSNYLEASKKAKDHDAEGHAYCGMAECHEALNDAEKAIASLEMYLDMGRMQDPKGQARACCNLGIIYYHQKKFEQAVVYFEKLFEVARTLENQNILDIARVNLGVARGAARMEDYIPLVKENLMGLLQWKNNRMPFSNKI